jgi:hypothetical protein
MIHLKRTQLDRRALLGRIGSAALALPFLPALAGRARAAGPTAKNFLMVSLPNGIDPLQFWPTGGERDFTLGPILAPLEPHRDKLLIAGPQFADPVIRQPVAGTGLRLAKTPGIHRAWVATTCHSIQARRFDQTGDGLNVRTGHPSVDQLIASKLAAKTRFPSLEFGVHAVGGDVPCILNFGLDGSPLPRMMDDRAAWERVFGGLVSDPAAAKAIGQRRSAVSDFLHARFAALAPALGKEDRLLLDGHLQSLREVEARVAGPGGAGTCAALRGPGLTPASVTEPTNPFSDTPALTANMQDMVALAFACDLTRVASLCMSHESCHMSTTWLGFKDEHHAMSHHGGNVTKREKYNKVVRWHAEMLARMLDRLKAFPHPAGGTVYDQTLVWWMFRHGDGNAHASTGIPGIIAGGAGGHFGPMGRYLNLPGTELGSFLFSLVNAMGVEIDAFGLNENRVTAPVAALRG